MSASAAATNAGPGRGSSIALGGSLAAGAAVTGALAGVLTTSGHGAATFALGAIAVVVVLWRTPTIAPVVLMVAALTIEQFPLTQPQTTEGGARPSDLTDRIPLFHGIAPSVHISPADLLLLVLFTIWMLKRGTASLAKIAWSEITKAVFALVVVVVLALFVGQAHHGNLRTAFTEIRPYFYLAIAYLIASVFTTKREVIRWALWAIVLSTGFKAMQAIVSFLRVRHEHPRPDYVVGHEEALFFGIFILTTLALWLFEFRGSLRTTATLLLPVVVLADLVNTRRAAWLIFGGALIVFAAVGMASLPRRRRFLRRTLLALAIVSLFYFPAYWNHSGALAGPARAVHSAIKPNPRDESSDLYRVQENANLRLNIREGGFVGRGFGVPIDYVIPIVNLDKIDPLIAYIPHNGVFYILMRMGLLGGIVFWSLLAAGIIAGCRLARTPDREFACLGALLPSVIVAYALEGYNDQGFFMYRIAFVVGALLGLVEAARRIAAKTTVAPPALLVQPAHAVAAPAPTPARAPRMASPVAAPRAGRSTPKPKPRRRPIDVAAERLPASVRVPRRNRRAQFAAGLLFAIAVACLVWVFVGPPLSAVSRLDVSQDEAVFMSTGGSASIVLRDGSAKGRVLYSGSIEKGRGVAATGGRLWVHLRAPKGVTVMSGKQQLVYRGTANVLVSPQTGQVLRTH